MVAALPQLSIGKLINVDVNTVMTTFILLIKKPTGVRSWH